MGQSTFSQGQEPGRARNRSGVLPSYSPELNPAESIFEEVRRHVEGRIYESLHEKREEAEIYLKELAAEPERVKHLCGWGWLRESLESLPL